MRDSHDREAPGRAATLAWLVLLGAVLGCAAGLLEATFVTSRGGAPVGPAGTVNVAVFYAILWAVAGAVLGVLSLATGAVSGRAEPEASRRAFWGSLLASLLVLVLVGGLVNVLALPTMFSRESLLFDGALAVGCVILWLVLFRLSRRVMGGSGRRGWFRSPIVLTAVGLGVILVVLGTRARPSPSTPTGDQPGEARADLNIVLVVVDALRADHLGCYGYDRRTSPNIDRMAAEGVMFANAYAQAPRTKESTASLVTSLYPSTHGVARLGGALSETSLTVMELMRAAGYVTATVSANPLVSPTFGFGRGVEFFYTEAPSVTERTVLRRVTRTLARRTPALGWLATLIHQGERALPFREQIYPFDGRDAARLNEAFFSWADGLSRGPFFAYVHYMEPHAPYAPPSPFDELFDPDYAGPEVTGYPTGESLMLPFVEGEPLPDAERLNMVAQYDGSIAYFDREFGRLLEGLQRRGLVGSTLVILTSDHGEEFYDHRGWGHGQSLYEELIRVPLIVWCPGRIPAGRAVDEIVRHVDLMPTILGAAGVVETLDAPELEGVNLWAMLETDSTLGVDLQVFAEVLSGGHFARALRKGHWKLIRTAFGGRESVMLFDLAKDASELEDLSEERSEIAESMLAELDRLTAAAGARRQESPTLAIDRETEEKLRALGYVQ